MNKYKVYGTVTVLITKEVYADNEEEARDVAADRFSGLANFCGNGGTDYLVGVYNDDEDGEENIFVDDAEPDFSCGEVILEETNVNAEETFTVAVYDIIAHPYDNENFMVTKGIPRSVPECEVTCYEDDLKDAVINKLEDFADFLGYEIENLKFTIIKRRKA